MTAAAKRVLIVDDSTSVRRTVLWILEPLGIEVLEAGQGQEALDLLAREKVDLAIVDLNMPVMDGLELIRRLRSDPSTRHLPILMMTTEMRPQDQISAHEAGADMYLVKPSTPAVIRYKVLSLLGLRDVEGHASAAPAGGPA